MLDLLVEGRTNAEIADRLGISFAGAKWHVGELLTETGCEDRQALAYWWEKARDTREQRGFLTFARATRVTGVGALALTGAALVIVILIAAIGALDGRFQPHSQAPSNTNSAGPDSPSVGEPIWDTAPNWSQAHYVSRDGSVLTVRLDDTSDLIRIDLERLGVFDCRVDCYHSNGTLGALSDAQTLCIGWLGVRQGHQDGMLWVERYTCEAGGRVIPP